MDNTSKKMSDYIGEYYTLALKKGINKDLIEKNINSIRSISELKLLITRLEKL